MKSCAWMLLAAVAFSSIAAAQRFHRDTPFDRSMIDRTPIIVTLHASAKKRLMRADDIPSIRAQTRDAVDHVLQELPLSSRLQVTRRFGLIAAFAMQADAATIARLRRDPRVRSVDLDLGGDGNGVRQPADAASALNRVDLLDGHGMTGAGMKVAIIDSGIDTDHPDFAGRIVGQQCFCSVGTGCCPNGGMQQAGNGSAEDDHGHGTNVAGIVAGNGMIAPRGALPQVSIVAVKVLDRNNSFRATSDVIAAMDWVAQNHPDVDAVNLSLGTDALFKGDCTRAGAWIEVIATAVDNLNALGAVVVASSGNRGSLTAMSAPACIGAVVSTGATWDYSGGPITLLGCSEAEVIVAAPTCFSNRNATTDLFAAGAFVTAPGLGGGTSTFGATSQAAPMATACAVALKQVAPQSTVQQRIESMRLTEARVDDPASGRRYPFLDCFDAAKLMNPTVANPRPLIGSMPLLPPRTPASGRATNLPAHSIAPQRKSISRQPVRRSVAP